ncbi:MAG: tyrosine-type recombinase/integrase [Vibrio splendidus]
MNNISSKEASPVKTKETIRHISYLLKKHYGQQYADVWDFGVQVALRISDILKIEFEHIADTAEGSELFFMAKKTNKRGQTLLNERAREVVVRRKALGDQYLFQSNSSRPQDRGKPMSSRSMNRALQEISNMVGIKLSTHSMRKTWGYHVYQASKDIALVQDTLQHSSPKETLRYIGIDKEKRDETFKTMVL